MLQLKVPRKQFLLTCVDLPLQDQRDKTVVLFHDESTFSSNDDHNIMWGVKGQKVIKPPKSKGAGIMVSGSIDEFNGFLAFSDEEYGEAKKSNPIHKEVCSGASRIRRKQGGILES